MRLIPVLLLAACSSAGSVTLDNGSWLPVGVGVDVEHVPGGLVSDAVTASGTADTAADPATDTVEGTDTGDSPESAAPTDATDIETDTDTDAVYTDTPADSVDPVEAVTDVEPAPVDPFTVDSDGDGLSDGWETSMVIRYMPPDIGPFWRNGTTDPLNPDTDGDGLLDGDEHIEYGVADPTMSNPLMLDTDGDNWTDGQERRAGSWPNHADTDGDQVPDGSDPCPLGPAGCPNPVPKCADGHSLCP